MISPAFPTFFSPPSDGLAFQAARPRPPVDPESMEARPAWRTSRRCQVLSVVNRAWPANHGDGITYRTGVSMVVDLQNWVILWQMLGCIFHQDMGDESVMNGDLVRFTRKKQQELSGWRNSQFTLVIELHDQKFTVHFDQKFSVHFGDWVARSETGQINNLTSGEGHAQNHRPPKWVTPQKLQNLNGTDG